MNGPSHMGWGLLQIAVLLVLCIVASGAWIQKNYPTEIEQEEQSR